MNKFISKLGIKNFIWLCVMAVMGLVLIGTIIIMLSSGSKHAMKEYTLLARSAHSSSQSVIDFEMLSAENEDIAAWLLSEGTGIDYPIVHSSKNEYYRNHSFSGKRNKLGCLYIDSSCAADLSGRNTVIYGGELLAPLYNYSSQDYYELMPYLTLYTPQGKYIINLIAGVYTKDISKAVKTEFASRDDFDDYISHLRSSSRVNGSVKTDEDTRLITLCAEDRNGAFVLVGIQE